MATISQVLSASEDEQLRCAALDVLVEMLSKRMEPEAKLLLIQQLGVVQLCASWQGQLPGQADSSELAQKCAELLCTILLGKSACCSSFCMHGHGSFINFDCPNDQVMPTDDNVMPILLTGSSP